MNTIDRHIVVTFIRSYLILLGVGIGLYVLADLLTNLDEFTENPELSYRQVLAAMMDYYGHNLPLYFTQLGGPVLAFAGAYTVANMLRSNELTPLVAAGVPLQRVAVPILITGAVVIGLWLVNREFLLPEFAHKIARSRDDLVGTRERSVDFARDDNNAVLIARRISLNEGRLEGVVIHVPAGSENYVIQADAAVYDPHQETWVLEVGRVIHEARTSGPRRAIVREPISEFPFGLAPSELVLRESSRWAELLSLRQMNALLRSRNLPNLAIVEMNRHIWLTQPLLQFLLLGLTLPYFLTREPGNVLGAGGKALAVGAAFFAVTFFAHSMVATDHAALVAWIPLLVFSPIAVLQFANVKT